MGYFQIFKKVLTYLISFSILITVFYLNKISKITFINYQPKQIEILNTSLLWSNDAEISRFKQIKGFLFNKQFNKYYINSNNNNSTNQVYEFKTCEYSSIQNKLGN